VKGNSERKLLRKRSQGEKPESGILEGSRTRIEEPRILMAVYRTY